MLHRNDAHPGAMDVVCPEWLVEDKENSKRMKLAVAISLYVLLVIIWLPMPSFAEPVYDVPAAVKQQRKNIKIKPKAVKPVEQVTMKPKQDTVPMPVANRPDMNMEPVIDHNPVEDFEPTEWTPDDPFAVDEPTPPGPPLDEVLSSTMQGLELPVITNRKQAVYPPLGLKMKMQGYVVLEAVLRKDGTVDEIRVIRGLGRGKFGFEEEAMKALKDWQFLPGKFSGKNVDVRMTLRIDFSLN